MSRLDELAPTDGQYYHVLWVKPEELQFHCRACNTLKPTDEAP